MTTTGVRLSWRDGERLNEEQRAALIGPGAPFELREEQVLGTTMTVFAQRPRDLRQVLRGAAERMPDRDYLVFPDRRYTFGDVVGPVAAVAAKLRDEYGVGKGDRVAIAAANCADYATTFWATTCLGAITVALNGWWTGPELQYAIELTTPKVVLGDGRRIERLDGRGLDLPVLEFPPDWSDAPVAPAGGSRELPDVELDEDDPFLILFTSGTTGRPKGATLSHRGNIHFLWASMLAGACKTALYGGAPMLGAQPCVISCSPMFHIAGMNSQLVMGPVTGMKIVYSPPGKWREDVHLQLTEEHRATNWSLVPTQLWRILDYPDLDSYDLSSLRGVGGGSSVWPPELLRVLGERLPNVRPGLGVGYGMTETNGLGTLLRGPLTVEHPDSIGEPSPGVEVEVRDPATGEALGEGEVGEICLRTAASLLGYWDNPEATKAALDDDRWYRTGDFGHITGELVYLEGRRSDLIIRGGENVYPAEIENRLVEHPDIAEAAVVGVDHPRLGQEVKAFVVPAAGRSLTADDVRSWVGEALASFKVPTHVELVESLPHNAMGKVLKHLLGHPEQQASFVEE